MENQLSEGCPTQTELSQEEDVKVESSASEDDAKVNEITPEADMLLAARKEFNKSRRIVIKRVPDITVEQVKEFFGAYEVKDVNINKKCKHVTISLVSEDLVDEAVEKLDGQVLCGNPAIVRHNPCNRLLCVSDLPADMEEENFCKLMQLNGRTERCFLMRDAEGKSKGYGFVEFLLPRDEVMKICLRLNGHRLQSGAIIHCDIMKETLVKYDQLNSTCLYVGNLPKDFGDDDKLCSVCSVTATPIFCRVAKRDAIPVGFAIVEFAKWEDAEETCRKLQDVELDDHKIDIRLCSPGLSVPEAFSHHVSRIPVTLGVAQNNSALSLGELDTAAPGSVSPELVAYLKKKSPLVAQHFRHLVNKLFQHESAREKLLRQSSILGESPVNISAQLTRLNVQISLLSVHLASQVQQPGYNMAAMFGNPTVVKSIQMIQTMLANGIDYNDFEYDDDDDNIEEKKDTNSAEKADGQNKEDVTAMVLEARGSSQPSEEVEVTKDSLPSKMVEPTDNASLSKDVESKNSGILSDIAVETSSTGSVPAAGITLPSEAVEGGDSLVPKTEALKPAEVQRLSSSNVKIPSLMDQTVQSTKQSFRVMDLGDVSRILCHLEKLCAKNKLERKLRKQNAADVEKVEQTNEDIKNKHDVNMVESQALNEENATADHETLKNSSNDKEKPPVPAPLMSLPVCKPQRNRIAFSVNPVLASHIEMQLHCQVSGTDQVDTSGMSFQFPGIRPWAPSFPGRGAGIFNFPMFRPFGATGMGAQSILNQKADDSKFPTCDEKGNNVTPAIMKNIPSLLTLSRQNDGVRQQKKVASLFSVSGHSNVPKPQSVIRPLFGSAAQKIGDAKSMFSQSSGAENDNCSGSGSGLLGAIPGITDRGGVRGTSGATNQNAGRGFAHIRSAKPDISKVKPLFNNEMLQQRLKTGFVESRQGSNRAQMGATVASSDRSKGQNRGGATVRSFGSGSGGYEDMQQFSSFANDGSYNRRPNQPSKMNNRSVAAPSNMNVSRSTDRVNNNRQSGNPNAESKNQNQQSHTATENYDSYYSGAPAANTYGSTNYNSQSQQQVTSDQSNWKAAGTSSQWQANPNQSNNWKAAGTSSQWQPNPNQSNDWTAAGTSSQWQPNQSSWPSNNDSAKNASTAQDWSTDYYQNQQPYNYDAGAAGSNMYFGADWSSYSVPAGSEVKKAAVSHSDGAQLSKPAVANQYTADNSTYAAAAAAAYNTNFSNNPAVQSSAAYAGATGYDMASSWYPFQDQSAYAGGTSGVTSEGSSSAATSAASYAQMYQQYAAAQQQTTQQGQSMNVTGTPLQGYSDYAQSLGYSNYGQTADGYAAYMQSYGNSAQGFASVQQFDPTSYNATTNPGQLGYSGQKRSNTSTDTGVSGADTAEWKKTKFS